MDCILNGVSAYGIPWASFAVGYRTNNGGKKLSACGGLSQRVCHCYLFNKNIEKFISDLFF